jgi:hypothetical protein
MGGKVYTSMDSIEKPLTGEPFLGENASRQASALCAEKRFYACGGDARQEAEIENPESGGAVDRSSIDRGFGTRRK